MPVPDVHDFDVDGFHVIERGVDDASVAEFLVRIAVRSGSPITVNQMAVQVEGDAVGPDHDPVVGAVDEVLVKRGGGGDCVAAFRLAFGLRAATRSGVS